MPASFQGFVLLVLSDDKSLLPGRIRTSTEHSCQKNGWVGRKQQLSCVTLISGWFLANSHLTFGLGKYV